MIRPVPVPVSTPQAPEMVSTLGSCRPAYGANRGLVALRWAAAVATAVVMTPGPGECRLDDVRALYPRVCVERLN